MAHTDYVKMRANHKARRVAEKQDMRRTRAKVRDSLVGMRTGTIDADELTLPETRIGFTNGRCYWCGTPGFWCAC